MPVKSEFFVFLISICLCFVSCSKKNSENIIVSAEIKKNHTWYGFDEEGFKKINNPLNSYFSMSKPWTEAIRISDTGTASEILSDEQSAPSGYAIVNRLGLLVINDKDLKLFKDSVIFKDRTADNLVFDMNIPIFSVYRSSFFNSSKDSSKIHPFLINFSPVESVFFPMLNTDNLGLDKNSEITDFVWDGKFWTCSVKTTDIEKNSFSYLTFQPKSPILQITPFSASSEIFITLSNADEFRTAMIQKDFLYAPERIKNLIKTVEKNISIRIKSSGGHSPRTFIRERNTGEVFIKSTAILAPSWCCAVFEDGSVFFNGALYNKPIVNKGKTFAMRLPKLPSGFFYSDFLISGSTFLVAWEEGSFYKTGRSGFICVNLQDVFYENEK